MVGHESRLDSPQLLPMTITCGTGTFATPCVTDRPRVTRLSGARTGSDVDKSPGTRPAGTSPKDESFDDDGQDGAARCGGADVDVVAAGYAYGVDADETVGTVRLRADGLAQDFGQIGFSDHDGGKALVSERLNSVNYHLSHLLDTGESGAHGTGEGDGDRMGLALEEEPFQPFSDRAAHGLRIGLFLGGQLQSRYVLDRQQ